MTSSEDEDFTCLPSELVSTSYEFRGDLLPEKSRKLYQATYDKFIAWKDNNDIKMITENVMLEYFHQMNQVYKPSSLWAKYSMLRTMIQNNLNINLQNFKELSAYLKQQSSGYERKQSKTFTAAEMKNFLDNAPNDKYLLTKVVLIFGLTGAVHSADLLNLTVNDIVCYNDLMTVNIKDAKNKTIKEFRIKGQFLDIVKMYIALRPAHTNSNRFLLNYKHGKCTTLVVGKNKLGSMPKEIASFLNLPNPEQYTGHALRRSSANLDTNLGENVAQVKTVSDQNLSKLTELSRSSTNLNRDLGEHVNKQEKEEQDLHKLIENHPMDIRPCEIESNKRILDDKEDTSGDVIVTRSPKRTKLEIPCTVTTGDVNIKVSSNSNYNIQEKDLVINVTNPNNSSINLNFYHCNCKHKDDKDHHQNNI